MNIIIMYQDYQIISDQLLNFTVYMINLYVTDQK